MDDLLSRADSLGRLSDSAEHYTRTYLTPAHQAAARQLAAWMREAGMEVRTDAVGNVRGRYGGAGRTLMLGSHFDSVRNGGKYDGVLGILVPIACVAELHRRGETFPFAIEVCAFADEEGARFQTSFLCSRVLVDGRDALDPLLDRRDAGGITLREAMVSAGLDAREADAARVDPARLAAYVEVHIEQGPVLLDAGRPLGVVTAIASGSRHRVRVVGEAGHAGTVPMTRRRDALAAAAEMVLAVEKVARRDRVVGTVGLLEVRDGTGNVIPGEVAFSIDLRAPDDTQRHRSWEAVSLELEAIAAARRVTLAFQKTHDVPAAPCAPWIQERLAASIARVGAEPMRLPSGAGHDAMILARITDVGMLFVRCGAGGVSHHPAETVSGADARLAGGALIDFIRRFDTSAPGPSPTGK